MICEAIRCFPMLFHVMLNEVKHLIVNAAKPEKISVDRDEQPALVSSSFAQTAPGSRF
jgi:hypothetical protein